MKRQGKNKGWGVGEDSGCVRAPSGRRELSIQDTLVQRHTPGAPVAGGNLQVLEQQLHGLLGEHVAVPAKKHNKEDEDDDNNGIEAGALP